MRVAVAIPPEFSTEQASRLALYFLDGIVAANRGLLRAGLVPGLYSSGVRYAEEVDDETFVDALTCWRRKLGDCAHLAAWRLAELLEDCQPGEQRPRLKIACREPRAAYRILGANKVVCHVTVLRSDGTEEDPSKLLGMKG